jgi:hypothetical protein
LHVQPTYRKEQAVMTIKKASSCVVAVGAAFALFAVAAGLSRPTSTTTEEGKVGLDLSPQPAVLATGVQQQTAARPQAPNVNAVPSVFVERIAAPEGPSTTARASRTATRESRPAQPSDVPETVTRRAVERESARSTTQQLPMPEFDALGRPVDDGQVQAEHLEQLENLDLGLPAVPDEADRLMLLPAGAIKNAALHARAAEHAHGASPRGPGDPDCSTDESGSYCGEDCWYHRNLAGGFNRLLFNTNANDTEWVLDDATMGADGCVGCSFVVGYVTDSTDLVRIKLRIFQPGFAGGCGQGTPPDVTGTPTYEFEWCAPGSPDGTTTFLTSIYEPDPDISLVAGTFAYQITVQSTNQNVDLTGLPLTNPGTNVLGTANTNGNTNCFYHCSHMTSCGGPFGIGAYAGYYFAIQSTARRAMAPHGITSKFDPSDGTTFRQPFTPDCDINGNLVINDADRLALKNGIDENFGSTGPFLPAVAVFDVDGNNRIDFGDWEAWLICKYPTVIASTGTAVFYNPPVGNVAGQGIITSTNITNSPNGYVPTRGFYRFLRFTDGGGGLVLPANEVNGDLPFNVADNNATGSSNPGRIFRDGSIETAVPVGERINGVADVDVELNLLNRGIGGDSSENFFTGDYIVTLVHVGITTTLVSRPYNGTTGNAPDKGYFVVFDDGEDDGSPSPGGANTAPAQHARSNFQVFGRFKPRQPLDTYVGRTWGGAFSPPAAGGPGAWRIRVRDLDSGGSGTIVSWGLRGRLGPVITGFIPSGDDYARTLGCEEVGAANGTFYTFSHPLDDPGDPEFCFFEFDPCNPIPRIPANFFNPGSEPFTGSVAFEGAPIDPGVSDYDLVLRRQGSVNLDPGGSGTGVVLVRMNLVSCSPLAIAYKDRDWDELWNAQINIDEFESAGLQGAITLYPTGDIATSASGRYWERLRFRPIVTFRKASDPTSERRLVLNEDTNDFLQLSTGEEFSGEANPSCTDCRGYYVNDPNRLGQALGTGAGANPHGIVQPDQSAVDGHQVNFARNVRPGPGFQVAKAEYDGLHLGIFGNEYNLDWARHTVRASVKIPTCSVDPAEEKTLPTDLIIGTWNFGPYFPIISEANRPFIGLRPAGTDPLRFATTSENKPGFQNWTFAAVRVNREVTLGRAEWWGAAGSPGSGTEVNDYPNDEVEDQFTLRVYKNRIGTGSGEGNPPLPDLGEELGMRNLNDPGETRPDYRATRRRTGTFQPNNNAAEYQYEVLFDEITVPNDPDRNNIFWLTIYNNTETVLPDTGEPDDASFSRWRWTAAGDSQGDQWDLFFVGLQDFNALNTNRAMRLFERSEDDSKVYSGDSLASNPCISPYSGLSYLVSGNPDNSGEVQINGTSTLGKDDQTPLQRNRWVSVRAPIKNNGFDNRKIGPIEITDPAVREALEDILSESGKDPGDWNCEIDEMLAALPQDGYVDHVFGGKLHFDSPNVSGVIQQLCKEMTTDMLGDNLELENATTNTITQAGAVLHGNLDLIGIAMVDRLVWEPCGGEEEPPCEEVGEVVMYVRPQEKDCNDNGVPDHCDIDCSLPGCEVYENCGEYTWSGGSGTTEDCNDNGIPDECEVIAEFGGDPANDCNADGTPDSCHSDCNNNGIPDPCEVDSCDPDNGGCCVNNVEIDCLQDCDGNSVPDVCQPDCTGTGLADPCDIAISEGGTCDSGPICAPGQNPLDDDCCDRDCNADGIPDSCQEVGGDLPEPPADYVHANGTVVGGMIDFENYSVGALIPTPGQFGQQGWEVKFPSIFGFGGGSTTNPSPDMAQVVTFGEDCSESESDSVLTNRAVRLQHDAAAASTSFWSVGVKSPPMHNDSRLITLAEVDLYFPSPNLNSDNVFIDIAFENQNAPFGRTLMSRLSDDTELRIAPGLDTDGGITYLFFDNDPFPPDDQCWTLGIMIDGSRTDYPLQYRMNGFAQLFNSDGLPIPWTIAATDLIPGQAPNANYMLIMSNNRDGWPGIYFDNIRFRKASPFDVGLEDCTGEGLANGCRIRDLLAEDCNCNGRPDECDIVGEGPGTCNESLGRPASGNSSGRGGAIISAPCSEDCDEDGVPDECQVEVRSATLKMFHNMEQNAEAPTFVVDTPIVGQPTEDPLASVDDCVIQVPDDFAPIPNWRGPLGGFFAPAAAFLKVSVDGGCPDDGQAIAMMIDDTDPVAKPTNGTSGYGIISGIFGLLDDGAACEPVTPARPAHILVRQRMSMDVHVEAGRSTYRMQPQGDAFAVGVLRLARDGTRRPEGYSDSFRLVNGSLVQNVGGLAQNQIQAIIGSDPFIGTIWGTLTDVTTGDPLTWPEGECWRLIMETDLCRDEFNVPDPVTRFDGENLLVGVDLDMDGVPETFARMSAFSTNMRNIVLISDNYIHPDHDDEEDAKRGTGYFDNIELIEFESFEPCQSPCLSCEDPFSQDCSPCDFVPECALTGDMNNDDCVNGDDIQKFSECAIAGSVSGDCACADMDASGTYTSADVDDFVDKLLTLDPNCP